MEERRCSKEGGRGCFSSKTRPRTISGKGWPSGSRRGSGKYGCGRQIMADRCRFHHDFGASIITKKKPSTSSKRVESCNPTSKGSGMFHISVSVNSKKGLGQVGTSTTGSARRSTSILSRKHVTRRVSSSSGTFHVSVSVNCDQQLRETAGRRRVRVSLSVRGVLVSGTRVAVKRLELDDAQGAGAG